MFCVLFRHLGSRVLGFQSLGIVVFCVLGVGFTHLGFRVLGF